MGRKLLRQLYEHLASLEVVLQQPCMPCSCLASGLQKTHKSRKENELVENSVFDDASALQPFFVGQSCNVVFYTLRLPCETKKFVVGERYKADVKQALLVNHIENCC